jgi:hypothetical protein
MAISSMDDVNVDDLQIALSAPTQQRYQYQHGNGDAQKPQEDISDSAFLPTGMASDFAIVSAHSLSSS